MRAYSITAKGQVTIPVELREKLKLRPGDRITYEKTPNGILLKPVKGNMLADFGFLKGRETAKADIAFVRDAVRKKIANRK